MIDTFKAYLDKTNLSENSKSAYLFAFRQFSDKYGTVTKKNLTAYKVWLVDNFKPQTVNLRLRGMNCYLESVGKEKWKLTFVKVQQKPFLENVISEADYEYFKKSLKDDGEMFWYFVIRFLAATGARVSELIQIKVEHVKLGYLDLYSKGGKLRRIYIPATLQEEASQWLGVSSLSNALTGKMPGLSSIQSTGQPGADDPTIFIRGVGSLSTDLSAPLVLVDGVERSFNQIDPNEVEDITILKDASSTAVFGVRGANGVVLVTTKRGTEGKPRMNFSTSFAVQTTMTVGFSLK